MNIHSDMVDLLAAMACLGMGFFGLGFCLAWWIFRERLYVPRKVNRDDEFVGGWNQEDGAVWCGLCDWRGNARSVEHMEAIITDHMGTHGLFPISRTDLLTGERTEFPREK